MSLPVLTSAFRYVPPDEASGRVLSSCFGFVVRAVQSLLPLFILFKKEKKSQTCPHQVQVCCSDASSCLRVCDCQHKLWLFFGLKSGAKLCFPDPLLCVPCSPRLRSLCRLQRLQGHMVSKASGTSAASNGAQSKEPDLFRGNFNASLQFNILV